MKLNDFIKKGIVKKSEKDAALAKSLTANLSGDLEFLNSLEISEKSARKIMSNYYDCLRTIIEAMAALDGLKSYSHEAFAFYLKENKNEEIISEKFDRFRKIRNGIEYYGKDASKEEVLEHKKEILRVIAALKEKYLKEVKDEKN